MPYKVLVVDDSSFFRRRVSDILNSEAQLEVIDVAVNGVEAVDKAIALKPDVITMDIEMPELNGIEAVRQIMAKSPTSILMFSSLTHQGAKATLDALDAGALDFLPKKFNEIAASNEDAGAVLKQRVLELARKRGFVARKRPLSSSITSPTPASSSRFEPRVSRSGAVQTTKSSVEKSTAPSQHFRRSSGKNYKLLAIGTSTGGPIALQKVLTALPANFPMPIILVQHMPAAFTGAFANRLNNLCKISVKEAQNGDLLKPGCAYLAPGGTQMLIDGTESAAKLKVIEDTTERVAFKPSVDVSFASAAKIYQGHVLAVILTGMGADGREGARMLKNKGSTIWAQDEASCVVYGMPQAVTAAGLSSLSLPLDEFSDAIIKEIGHG